MLVAAIGFAVGVERLTAVDPNTSLRRPDKYSTSTDFTSTSTPNALAPSSGMLTGISRQVPKWDAMPLLESIPWTSSDATRRFNQAGSSRSCDLFSPGMNTWQDLLPARPGVAAAIGRHPVFSVALTMQTAVREGLPKLSRKKIENYLRDHVLVLQSRLYHHEAGTVFFGDKLGAAFSSVKQPTVTMKPEAMIGTAITEFRTLGLYSPADSDKSKADHRTLVLAFRYSAGDDLITGAAGVLKEYGLTTSSFSDSIRKLRSSQASRCKQVCRCRWKVFVLECWVSAAPAPWGLAIFWTSYMLRRRRVLARDRRQIRTRAVYLLL
jgi:hypothetical protein